MPIVETGILIWGTFILKCSILDNSECEWARREEYEDKYDESAWKDSDNKDVSENKTRRIKRFAMSDWTTAVSVQNVYITRERKEQVQRLKSGGTSIDLKEIIANRWIIHRPRGGAFGMTFPDLNWKSVAFWMGSWTLPLLVLSDWIRISGIKKVLIAISLKDTASTASGSGRAKVGELCRQPLHEDVLACRAPPRAEICIADAQPRYRGASSGIVGRPCEPWRRTRRGEAAPAGWVPPPR